MVRIYNGILFIHKNNEFESLVVRSINLEPVKQSEVSQKEKKKIVYECICTYRIYKNYTGKLFCRVAIETQT